MKTQWKRALFIGLMTMGIGMLGRRAEAVAYDTMNVMVTPGNLTYAVQITSVTLGVGYNFGTVNIGQTTGSTKAIGVQNTGNVAEFFAMYVGTTTGAGTAWAPAGADGGAANDVFELQGHFLASGSIAYPDASYGAADWIGGIPASAGSGNFGQVSKTASNVSKDLWLKMSMPTSISDTSQNLKTMVLTITGQGS